MKLKPILKAPFGCLQRATRKGLLLVAASLCVASVASGATIGMNFVRGAGGDGSGVQDTLANSLQPTDTAGASGFEQMNWNNLGSRGTNIALIDSTGVSSGVTVNWVANNCWSMAGGGTPTAQGMPDANLMNSYLDSNGGGNTTFRACHAHLMVKVLSMSSTNASQW